MDERITQLQRLRDNLTECIGCGCLPISRCRLGNVRDELAERGPGPHRLFEDLVPETKGSPEIVRPV